MKISYVNNLESRLGSFKDLLDKCTGETDSVADKENQAKLQDKIKEVELILYDLKVSNNSAAAKIQKWFKENAEKYMGDVQFLHVFATEKSFSLGIDHEFFGLDLTCNEMGEENNKFDNKRFDRMTNRSEFSYYSRWDSKKKHPIKESMQDIEEFIKLESVSAYSRLLKNEGIALEFNYSKKMFKDEEAVKDVLDIFMKSFTLYLNGVKTNLDSGVYNPPIRKARA